MMINYLIALLKIFLKNSIDDDERKLTEMYI